MARTTKRIRSRSGALAYQNTITSAVDEVHREMGYTGGRVAIAGVFDTVPGFLFAVSEDLPPGLHGVMQRVAGCVRILVDGRLPKAWQRFAVGHEIGHALLHAGHLRRWALRSREPIEGDEKERQADRFAAELLLPLWALEDFVEKPRRLRGQKRIASAASYFEIPEGVARLRLATLDALLASGEYPATGREIYPVPLAEVA